MTICVETATAIRVMLVDDHKMMLWGMEKLIESQSPEMQVVGTASTCEEAALRINALIPDIVLLDLDLNGNSSLEILPSILANGVSRALIFTGSNDCKLLDTAVLRGARGVLRKDVAAEQVIKAIEKVHRGELWLDSDTLARVFNEMMTPVSPKKLDAEEQKRAALTTKERKIIALVVSGSGASNKVLAQQVFISEYTLRNHLTAIYQKLGISNRLELYVYAVKHQLGTVAD